jgi:hypothetical protein
VAATAERGGRIDNPPVFIDDAAKRCIINIGYGASLGGPKTLKHNILRVFNSLTPMGSGGNKKLLLRRLFAS